MARARQDHQSKPSFLRRNNEGGPDVETEACRAQQLRWISCACSYGVDYKPTAPRRPSVDAQGAAACGSPHALVRGDSFTAQQDWLDNVMERPSGEDDNVRV